MKPYDWMQWLMPWEPSVTFAVVLGGAAWVYIRGAKRSRISMPRRIYFWLGLAFLYFALLTHFDFYSEHAFFMHRIQHSMLHHMGPFLLALSRPGLVMAAGIPSEIRRKFHKALVLPQVQFIVNIFNNPAVAVALFSGLIGLWLIPAVHFIAMLDWRWYRIMNWSMAINGLLFWNLTLNNYCFMPACLSAGTRILMLLFIMPAQIAIGVLLFAAPRELYPVYTLCGRIFSLSPLADQQVGGWILWNSAMMSVVGVLIILYREWFSRRLLS